MKIKQCIELQRHKVPDEQVIHNVEEMLATYKDKMKALSAEMKQLGSSQIEPDKLNFLRIVADSQRTLATRNALMAVPNMRTAIYYRDRVDYMLRRYFENHGRDGNGPEPNATDKDLERWLKQHPMYQKCDFLVRLLEDYSAYSRELAEMYKSRLFTLRDVGNFLDAATGQY